MAFTAAQALIQQRYEAVHSASPKPAFCAYMERDGGGAVSAALGYRRAHRDRLFLESYLDMPIEHCLAQHFQRAFERQNIVEIGNLASDNAFAMIGLWADAANDLGSDAEVAVAVLTAPLRSMFRRLGIQLHELAPARAERLGNDAALWGSYYLLDPVICAGFIAEGQERLAAVVQRRRNAA